jgi:hypothetical protein
VKRNVSSHLPNVVYAHFPCCRGVKDFINHLRSPKHTVLQAIGSCMQTTYTRFQTINKFHTHTHKHTHAHQTPKHTVLQANGSCVKSSYTQFQTANNFTSTHTRSPNTKTHRVTGNWKLLENNLHTVFCYQAFFTPTPTNTYKNSSASVCD